MITAALITFAILALAWIFAPSDRPAAPHTNPETRPALPPEPLAEAA